MLGNMMTLMYMFGLAVGSLVAYWIENRLGPMDGHPCPPYVVKYKNNIPLLPLQYINKTQRSRLLHQLLLQRLVAAL